MRESQDTNKNLIEEVVSLAAEPPEGQSMKVMDSTPKYKMTFEGDAAIKLSQLTDDLKKRGVEVRKLWNLLSEEILQKSSSFWAKWLENVTPGEFYLDVIKKDPEMEAKLEAFLKQMYLSRGKVTLPKRKSKRSPAVLAETSSSEGQ